MWSFQAIWICFLVPLIHSASLGGKNVKSEPDWAPFRVVMESNSTKSLDLIQQFPLYHYWDLLRGSFRIGIIEKAIFEDIHKSQLSTKLPLKRYKYTNFTTVVDKNVNHIGKQFVIQHEILDTSQIFMHLLTGIQALSSKLIDFSSYLSSYEDKHQIKTKDLKTGNAFYFHHYQLALNQEILSNYSAVLSSYFQLADEILDVLESSESVPKTQINSNKPVFKWNLSNLTSFHSLQMKKQIMKSKLQLADFLIDYENLHHQNNLLLLQEKFNLKKENLNEFHQKLNQQLKEFNETIFVHLKENSQETSFRLDNYYLKEQNALVEKLKKEFADDLIQYEIEKNTIREIISFRQESEKSYFAFLIQKEITLTELQSKDAQMKNELFISLIFNEVIDRLFQQLFGSSDEKVNRSAPVKIDDDDDDDKEETLQIIYWKVSSNSFPPSVWKQYKFIRSLVFRVAENHFLMFSFYFIAFFLFVLTSIELIKSLQLIIYKYYFQRLQLFSQEKFQQSFLSYFLRKWLMNILVVNGFQFLSILLRLKSLKDYHGSFYYSAEKRKENSLKIFHYFSFFYHLIYSSPLQLQLLTILENYSLALNYNYYSSSSSSSFLSKDRETASFEGNPSSLSLKNYLFYGAPGCGKTISVRSILHYLQANHSHSLSTIMISGSDLLSLGSLSGNYLKEMMNSYEFYRMPLLLVIDECDSILYNRDLKSKDAKQSNESQSHSQPQQFSQSQEPITPIVTSLAEEDTNPEDTAAETMIPVGERTPSPSNSSPQQQDAGNGETIEKNQQKMIQNTLFSLLEGLRRPSPYLSVILVTRLNIKEVDSAILDRMDSVVGFSLPRKYERLQYICQQFSNQLVDFVGVQEKEQFQRFAKDFAEFKESREKQYFEDGPEDKKSSGGITQKLFDLLMILSGEEIFRLPKEENIEFVSEFPHSHLLEDVFQETGSLPLMNDWHRLFSPEMDNHQFPITSVETGRNHLFATPSKSSSSSTRRTATHTNPIKLSQSKQQHFSSTNQKKNSSTPAVSSVSFQQIHFILSFLQRNLEQFSDDRFEFVICFKVFLLISCSWSFRDLHKKLMNLRYQVLCSER
jgi:DNA polymerase III delta prime subunit